jgi:arginyl-tRNA synthetase
MTILKISAKIFEKFQREHMSETLIKKLQEGIARAYPKAFGRDDLPVEITRSTQPQFGHYQYNSSMKLASLLKENPRKIAEKLHAYLPEALSGIISKSEVAGPGFINFWIAPKFLEELLLRQLHDPHLLVQPPKKERVVIDFSSPNIAKEMHVGHLRSTIIGDALSRIFEFLGHDVLRLNHVGDWGTSFGMLIAYMKEYCKDSLKDIGAISLTDLVTFYKASKALFDKDPEFKKRAQLEVVALQSGKGESIAIWESICEISRRAYQEIYDLLDVEIIERGESFYNPQLASVVADFEKKGLVTISEGAKCVFLEGFQSREGTPLPLMIQKSDGGYNYDTTDLAALRHRVEDEKADRIIYVTDAGQATHFAMVFKAGELVGYYDPKKIEVDHVPFGLVLGPDGKKFRTRSGDTEKLIDLLSVAQEKAYAILQERNPEWNDEERKEVAHAIGIGAIKYADLSSNRISDYVFSYDKMLRFEGNTIAFVMYAYVRAESIKRKVGLDIEKILSSTQFAISHPAEEGLAVHLLRFPEVIDQITEDLLPNHLTDYLYDLSQLFNIFFRDCRVEGVAEQNVRLLLVEAAARVFKTGFSLLGIRSIAKM